MNGGADIVIHSTTKYIDGHAIQVGGAIIDSGNFDWGNGKYPSLTEPDESYHGLRYTESFGRAAYITKARVQLTRDLGVYPPAQAAFYTDLGLQTLPVRMQRHAENAMQVAEFLNAHPGVNYVNYPGLKNDKYHELAMKYLPKGQSGVMSFSIKGGREGAVRFMDRLQLANNVVHVADVRTCVLHPASATHRQLTSEQLGGGRHRRGAHPSVGRSGECRRHHRRPCRGVLKMQKNYNYLLKSCALYGMMVSTKKTEVLRYGIHNRQRHLHRLRHL